MTRAKHHRQQRLRCRRFPVPWSGWRDQFFCLVLPTTATLLRLAPLFQKLFPGRDTKRTTSPIWRQECQPTLKRTQHAQRSRHSIPQASKLHSYGTHRRRRRPNGNLRVGGWDYAAQITANMQEGLLFKAGGVISDNGAWARQLEGEPHIGM